MGGTSGVSFAASALLTTAPLPWQTTSCAGDVCRDHLVEDHQSTWSGVENDQLSADPVTARLKVAAGDGAVLVDSATEVTPERVDANGNGCGPIIWSAEVTVGVDGSLAAAPISDQR
ncbi:hypothetical protein [Kineococcus radiotolerans]|uniref:Uncharacterized protein n=1 Tax=Kineococcus radiotolerans (strain ATCC BAA-149 / DSM 14245 / SRS30216) TaxID=266940 RepID=A6W9V7_KINRD|nr:hypothetical protein [Kineococcus radiotolerans]ABS03596.1 hypothetical protein Krad_2111 [Kineococcus radiotolerans SRS30216 = ATCC BAA-149]